MARVAHDFRKRDHFLVAKTSTKNGSEHRRSLLICDLTTFHFTKKIRICSGSNGLPVALCRIHSLALKIMKTPPLFSMAWFTKHRKTILSSRGLKQVEAHKKACNLGGLQARVGRMSAITL